MAHDSPSHVSRRQFVASSAALTAAGLISPPLAARPAAQADPDAAAHAPAAPADAIPLQWLDRSAPAWWAGATLGVPWPRGAHRPDTSFSAAGEDGAAMAVQSWPLAYWPDGSLKWTGHALSPGAAGATPAIIHLRPGRAPAAPEAPLVVTEAAEAIDIDTGPLHCRISRSGRSIIAALEREGRPVATDGQLVCLLQDNPDATETGVVRRERLLGQIEAVTVEQAGPVRAVVKVEGRHVNEEGRGLLGFTLRLYFYAGSDAVRVMHTFIFDGDEERDFIAGLGLRLTVPMADELHDRHIRFTGEGRGVFGEAVRGLTGLRRDPGAAVRAAQVAGEETPPASEFAPAVRDRLGLIPAFGDYTLSQPTADGYEIRKRTAAGHGWVRAAGGKRASGCGYVGGPSGGLAFGLRNFWQSHPAQLDIREAHTDAAEVTLWLWSPEARPMDLRFYHDGMGMDDHPSQLEGLEITYEDYEPGFGTAHGIARTSELFLRGVDATLSREALADFAAAVTAPPLLACTPDQLLAAGVFAGLFSKPDRSTPARRQLEEQLDFQLAYYLDHIENQRWFGFWDYGDVMHSYDTDRHTWRYDVGGFAWANSELSPDLWLWMSYLRSGRADVFRMAEAMIRHTGEVDVYHLGRFKHLGTRHNVQHWGCSAKQLRISTPVYRRIYYYLTGDERVGDQMRALLDSDQTFLGLDPIRKIRREAYAPRPEALAVGLGTDFGSLAATWLTEWERTGDPRWRHRLVAAMESIGELPKGYFSPVRYDMHSGRFSAVDEHSVGVSHLSAVFGLVEVNAELIDLLDVPRFREAWLQYCILYNAPREEQVAALGRDLGRLNLRDHHSRLTAYAAVQLGDAALARRAWREFGAGGGRVRDRLYRTRRVEGPRVLRPIDEEPQISTNGASQWGLAAIQNLALVGDLLDEVANQPR